MSGKFESFVMKTGTFQPIVAETVERLVAQLRELLKDKNLEICEAALDRVQEEVSAQKVAVRRFARRRYRSYPNPDPEPPEEKPLQ